MIEIFFSSFATLFVIIDPVGIAAISISLTEGRSFRQKSVIIWRAGLVAFLVLLGFGWFGEGFLDYIGISMSAFRISGGILLFLTALEMLFSSRVKRRSHLDTEGDPSIYPLAMPLLAGPGAMTAMILLMGEQSSVQGELMVNLTLGFVMLLCVVLSLSFNRFSQNLGETAIQIINRFLAIVLAALAIQFIGDGLLEFLGDANA